MNNGLSFSGARPQLFASPKIRSLTGCHWHVSQTLHVCRAVHTNVYTCTESVGVEILEFKRLQRCVSLPIPSPIPIYRPPVIDRKVDPLQMSWTPCPYLGVTILFYTPKWFVPADEPRKTSKSPLVPVGAHCSGSTLTISLKH